MKDSKLKIYTLHPDKKLQNNLYRSQNVNLTLYFKSHTYKVDQDYLYVQSKFFTDCFKNNQKQVRIQEKFDEQSFHQIMCLIHGNAIEIQRKKNMTYYQIINFLGIVQIQKFVKIDMLQNIHLYDIFQLLNLAQSTSDQNLFNVCFQQLEKKQYAQLQIYQKQLLNLDIGLFKLVIKTQNKHVENAQKSSEYLKISNIISKYCQIHQYDENRYKEMIFQMLDIKGLTSKQFKEVFLKKNSVIQKNATKSMLIEKPKQQMGLEQFNDVDSVENSYQSSEKTNLDYILQKDISIQHLKMQNIYLRKKIKQIESQNSQLLKELKELYLLSAESQKAQHKTYEQFKSLNQRFIKKISQKSQKQIQNEGKLANYERMMNQLNQKTVEVQNLLKKTLSRVSSIETKQKKVVKSQKSDYAPISDRYNDDLVRSQFVPASFISQMMKCSVSNSNKVTKSQKEIPQSSSSSTPSILKKTQKSSLQKSNSSLFLKNAQNQQYREKVSFDYQPITIDKDQISKLSQIIQLSYFYTKKNLKLIFRRAENDQNFGEKEDFLQRKHILILIKTTTGEKVGCYITSTIPLLHKSFTEDRNAFMFSLTHNKKFKIKEKHLADTIYISDKYLLSFSNYLLISSNCLVDPSYYFWPEKKTSSQQDHGVSWFTGSQQFLIKCIEIYQVHEQKELQMMI